MKRRNVKVFWFFKVKKKEMMKKNRKGVNEIKCKGEKKFYKKDVF